MFNDLLRNIAQSTVQDLAVTASGALASHGYLAGNQQQAWIGSVCFLAMWAVNSYLQHTQTKGSK